MNLRTVALIGVCVLSLSGSTARAQEQQQQKQQAWNVNPEAIDFDLPGFARSEETRFRLDIFDAASDLSRDAPVRSSGVVSRNVKGGEDRLRVDLGGLLDRVSDGYYVATLLAMRRGESVRSEPSPVFILSRNRDLVATSSREVFWTKVGLSIAGAILLVPFLLR
jgi:hypothetical protein